MISSAQSHSLFLIWEHHSVLCLLSQLVPKNGTQEISVVTFYPVTVIIFMNSINRIAILAFWDCNVSCWSNLQISPSTIDFSTCFVNLNPLYRKFSRLGSVYSPSHSWMSKWNSRSDKVFCRWLSPPVQWVASWCVRRVLAGRPAGPTLLKRLLKLLLLYAFFIVTIPPPSENSSDIVSAVSCVNPM